MVREEEHMTAVLIVAVLLALPVPAVHAAAWWLGRHVRLVWRAAPLRASVTATVVRPVPSPRPLPGGQRNCPRASG